MSELLLRVLRRRASLLLSSADEFCREELTNRHTGALEGEDLSVFSVVNVEVVRAHAEFVGSNLTPSEKIGGGVTLHGIEGFDVKNTLGESKWFEFSRDRHRSIRLYDSNECLALATSLFEQIAQRECSASPEDVRGYVSNRLASADPEWVSCTMEPKRAKDWKKWLARKPKAPEPPHDSPGQRARASNGATPAQDGAQEDAEQGHTTDQAQPPAPDASTPQQPDPALG